MFSAHGMSGIALLACLAMAAACGACHRGEPSLSTSSRVSLLFPVLLVANLKGVHAEVLSIEFDVDKVPQAVFRAFAVPPTHTPKDTPIETAVPGLVQRIDDLLAPSAEVMREGEMEFASTTGPLTTIREWKRGGRVIARMLGEATTGRRALTLHSVQLLPISTLGNHMSGKPDVGTLRVDSSGPEAGVAALVVVCPRHDVIVARVEIPLAIDQDPWKTVDRPGRILDEIVGATLARLASEWGGSPFGESLLCVECSESPHPVAIPPSK